MEHVQIVSCDVPAGESGSAADRAESPPNRSQPRIIPATRLAAAIAVILLI
jgi:hypothetical protein